MPRPSLKKERMEQILDAYEDCVASHGLEGTTLEMVAEKAGLARALIRHNVGNRDDLKAALVERFLENSEKDMRELREALPRENRAGVLIDVLFDPAYSDPKLVLVSEALVIAGAQDPALARTMQDWTGDFIARIRALIAPDFPGADKKALDAVAAGLTGIYFNVEAMTPLGRMPKLRKASKAAALRLIQTLEM